MKALRRTALTLLPVVAFVSLGGAAHGQVGSGRSGMSTSGDLGNVDAFDDLSDFGRCFARLNRNGALAVIATAPGSREEAETVDRLFRGDAECLHGGTRVSASVIYLRGVMAEGLLAAGTEIPAGQILPAPDAAEVRSLHDAARCYATDHRSEVRALLETRLGSQEEVAAVAALWNDLRTCIPANLRVRLNAPWIRFLMAEALLRLPPPGATVAGN